MTDDMILETFKNFSVIVSPVFINSMSRQMIADKVGVKKLHQLISPTLAPRSRILVETRAFSADAKPLVVNFNVYLCSFQARSCIY